MVDENSLIALWLSHCRESPLRDRVEDWVLPVSHGRTQNILDGLVFTQLIQDSCPSVASGNAASPLFTAHSAIPTTLEHLILLCLSCFSSCYPLFASPRPDSH